mgnify:CR=1 FL=1
MENEHSSVVIAVTSQKGGPGKSTIAQNLACEYARKGHRVVLLDADAQRSCDEWANRRFHYQEKTGADTDNPVVKSVSGRLSQTIRDERLRYHAVIVDVAGRTSAELATALQEADVVLVPTAPTIKDTETTDKLIDILEDTSHLAPPHRLCLAVLNKVTSQKSEMKRAQEARSLFSNPNVANRINVLSNRVEYLPGPFNDADEWGLGVVELNDKRAKHRNAAAQIQLLAAELLKKLQQQIEHQETEHA